MTDVKKNGYMFIEFMDGKTKEIPFEGSEGWTIDSQDACLFVRFEDHNERYPLVNIRLFGPYYNTPEVQLALVVERGEKADEDEDRSGSPE